MKYIWTQAGQQVTWAANSGESHTASCKCGGMQISSVAKCKVTYCWNCGKQ